MHSRITPIPARHAIAVLGLLVLSGATVACSAGDQAAGEAATEISVLVPAGVDQNLAQAYADAFEESHAGVTIRIESRPTGADGENVIKTRLSTGEMDDVFIFNSGSLLSSLSPDKSLVDLSGTDFIGDISDQFTDVVSGDDGVYGVPWGTSRAGGIMYNKAVYKELGLEVPETWEDFLKNNEAVAAAGLVPTVQTYGDTFTAQILILGDFANIAADDADWAREYTKNNRSFAKQPALGSFEKLAELAKTGAFNQDYASATYDEGIRLVAQGEAAHYPMLSNYVATNVTANYPDSADDVGFFAVPSSTSGEAAMTIWMPLAAYIPRSIPEAKLPLAEEFLAFISSPEGCEVHAATASPAGPYLTTGCSVPDTAMPFVEDIATYVNEGRSSLALEFLSPVKGTSLPQFAVEVGSGMSSAEKAAADYDNDVAKQAKQLGLAGW